MTDPPGPGRSPPPLIQVGWIRKRLFDGADATFAHAAAAHPGVRRQPVDVVDRQPGVGNGGEAGVHGQRERIDHEAPAEGGATDAAEHGPVLEALVAQRGAGERAHRLRHPVDGVHRSRQLEQGQPHVLLLEEPDGDLLADLDLRRLAADDVRREVDARVLGQCDVGDHVGRFEVRVPLVGIDREADDRAAARDRGRLRRAAPAVGADGNRRVHQLAAVAALLYAQGAVGSGGPEPLAGRDQLRQRPHRHSAPGSASPVLTSTSQSNTPAMLRGGTGAARAGPPWPRPGAPQSPVRPAGGQCRCPGAAVRSPTT